MASAEGGSVPSGVGSSRLRGLGERLELSSPSGVRGSAPAENGFWRILNVNEPPFCTYMIKSEGAICISIIYSKFWGTCLPIPP